MAGRREGMGYQPQLDGVRALGVLGIIAFHARGTTFPGGYIGVDVFFVLSGFLITTLILQEHARTGTLSLTRFYVRRALRLLPALVVVCAGVAGAALLLSDLPERRETVVGTVTALTYTSSPAVAYDWADLGLMLHTWSLSVEEYFYFVWPLGMVLLLRRRAQTLRRAALALLAVAVLYRWGAALAGWPITRISYAPDTRAEHLLLGCALAVCLPSVVRHVRQWHAVAGAALLAVFVVWPGPQTHDLYYYGGSTAVGLLAAVIIAWCVAAPRSTTSRLLALGPMVWVGRRSYGIYLWNPPIVGIIAATPTPEPLQLPVKLVLTFLVPALSFIWVEQPFLRLKDRWAAASATRATAQSGQELASETSATSRS